ncbi:hypothetical protein [Sphingomonas sp. TDK1]
MTVGRTVEVRGRYETARCLHSTCSSVIRTLSPSEGPSETWPAIFRAP